MVKVEIKRLEWDTYNREHIALHDVTPEEFEEVCASEPIQRKGYLQRIILIGLTKKGKMLTVILEPKEQEGVYRPVTAYKASRKSRRDYAVEKGGEKAA